MDWETMYGQLIVNALPGVSFPADYDFVAEHENDIARVRTQAQVDATLERNQLRETMAAGIDRAALKQRLLNAGVSLADLDELEG
jgi:hypothetical protein